MDNGSLQPAATRSLRRLAGELAPLARTRHGVLLEPASLLHSSKIDPADLDGQKAEVVFQAIKRHYARGVRDIRLLPLFIGPSRALTEYLPERREVWQKTFPELVLRIGAPLYREGDDRLVAMLRRGIERAGGGEGGWNRVIVTDHGSPEPRVAAVRDALTGALGRLLQPAGWTVAAASMERRPGPEYAFNDPLLENLLRDPSWQHGKVLVSMLFLLPGRHAGPDGDVAEICRRAEAGAPGLETKRTGLLNEDPSLIEILVDRLAELYCSSREAK